MGGAEAAELAKLAETTYRDINIAFANELARFADALGHRRGARHRRRQQPALQPHPPARDRGRRPLHPRLSALLLDGDAGCARCPRVGRAVNDAMPGYAVDTARRAARRPRRRARADPRRRLSRRRQGDRVQRRVRGPRRAARRAAPRPVAADPLYDAGELARARLRALGRRRRSTRRSCRPTTPSTRELGPDDLPGARASLDGRGVLDAARFAGRWRRPCGASGGPMRERQAASDSIAATTRSPARPSP